MGLAFAVLVIVGFFVYVGVAAGAEALIVCLGITAAILGFAVVFAVIVGPVVGAVDAFRSQTQLRRMEELEKPPRDE